MTSPEPEQDMMPLAEVLMLAQSKGGAAHIETADFSLARLRSHGAIVLAKCLPRISAIHSQHHGGPLLPLVPCPHLAHPSNACWCRPLHPNSFRCLPWTTLKSIELRHNPIGGHGAHALAVALSSNATVVRVGMRGCSVGRVGAESFAELVVERGCSRLRHVDMSVNSAGLQGALRMKRALAFSSGKISVQMDNNIVLAEVLNSVTHGIGLLMTGVASTFMSQRASNGGSWAHSWSSQVYVCSLLTMYGASTLYHSFYFTLHTKELFHVFDQCAIYMLIAGTYTPVLAVSLHDQTMYSTWLLGLMWAICLSGITMTATYYGPLKGRISLTLYLVMGWAALVCIRDIAIVLPPQGLFWLVMGGVLYTLGVPFFVMDSDPTTSMYHGDPSAVLPFLPT